MGGQVSVMLRTAVESRGLLHSVTAEMKGYDRGFVDIYGMGQFAYEDGDYSSTVTWMTKALEAFPPHQVLTLALILTLTLSNLLAR